MTFPGNPPPRQEMAHLKMDQEIAAGEAHQEQDELRREAWAARGGTPLHRLWLRIRRAVDTEDRG